VFVGAVAVHAPIGLRNVLREWLRWQGRACDAALVMFALALFALGIRAVLALYLA
jgi:fumarate reductase subunit C